MDYLLDGLRIYGTVNYQDNYNRIVKYKPSIPTYSVQRNPNDPTVLDFFGGRHGCRFLRVVGIQQLEQALPRCGHRLAWQFQRA